ncbi:hypothetical protein JCM11251_007150 [Rhodosporidiobolus azoricus]
MSLYAYPEGNQALLKSLNLIPHPESGYYAETFRTDETTSSPFAEGATRPLATQIYYLLTPKSPKGKMHLNKSITFHTLHQGRARYTLIKPLPPSAPEGAVPEIKHVVMGADSSKGEVRQLVVEGGWWKASEIPTDDLAQGDPDTTGCLISEVVTPGFSFDDHKFLTSAGLVELFRGDEKAEGVEELRQYVRDE